MAKPKGQGSVLRPERYLYLPNFTSGGDKHVIVGLCEGNVILASRVVDHVELPRRVSRNDAQRVVDYNMSLEQHQSEWRKARFRRKLPPMLRKLVYK